VTVKELIEHLEKEPQHYHVLLSNDDNQIEGMDYHMVSKYIKDNPSTLKNGFLVITGNY